MMHVVDALPTLAAIVGKDLPKNRVYDGVDFPLYQVLEDHEASIETDPGAPDP